MAKTRMMTRKGEQLARQRNIIALAVQTANFQRNMD